MISLFKMISELQFIVNLAQDDVRMVINNDTEEILTLDEKYANIH